jgi:hypothetical protein
MRCTGVCQSLLGWLCAGGALALSACGSTSPCQGIKLGGSVPPTVAIQGSLTRLSGSSRRFDRSDICATYGRPRSIRNLSGGEQAWAYGPGVAVINTPGIPRYRFKHGSGRVILRRGVVVRIELPTQGTQSPISG